MTKKQTVNITIKDVAKYAGVSPITASRALTGSDKVRDKTKNQVVIAADHLGYIPNLAAGTLSSNVSNMVGIIVPNMSNSIFADTLQEISIGLRPAGYQLLIGNSDYSIEEEESLVRTFLSRRADAIVLTGHLHSEATIKIIKASGVPIVEMWSLGDAPLGVSVGTSNYESAVMATQHLIDRGRRKIAYIGGDPHGNDRAQARIAGYRDTLDAAGIDFYPSLMRTGPFEFETGSEAVDAFLKDGIELDAIFAASDIIALGALLQCLRKDIDVPSKIAICGLDDAPIARAIQPALTTVKVPRKRIGKKVAEVILAKLSGEKISQTVFDLENKLVIRETT